MKIKVIETFIQGKVSQELCEDALCLADGFAAVIDGVTSKSDFRYEGKTTGKLAAELVLKVLEKLDRDADAGQFISLVNREMDAFYEQIAFPYSREEQGLQAVCAVYSESRREIWMIGDCQARVDGVPYLNPKPSDEILAEMRSLVLNIVRAQRPEEFYSQETQQMARELIEPWILRSTVFANNDSTSYGYSVLNGREIPGSLIRVIRLDKEEHEVILTSDGYPSVEATLKQSEAALERVLKEDRECCRLYRSTKGVKEGCRSFDDRTYIRLTAEKAGR